MKILLYSANFAPEPVGIGKYSGEMAAWLAAQGHSVRVVCAPPYYPDWKLNPSYRSMRRWRETWQGVDVWRAPLWVPGKPSGLSRLMHLLSFALGSFPMMLWQVFWRPDVVFTVAPSLMCAPTGKLVAWLCGAKSWLHIQDFEVDVAFQMGLLKGKQLQGFVLGLERWLFRRFDMVSSISASMVKRLQQKGVVPCKVHLLPNWVDLAHVSPLQEPSSYRAELGIAPGTNVALFSGTLGAKQGLLLIPDAAHLLKERKDIVFVVCGAGPMYEQLEIASAHLPNLLLMPLQPFARLGDLLGLADIHLLTQCPDAEDLVLPSKLSGMLASGRPVLATCRKGTEIAEVVAGCGLTVPPEDANAIADALVELVDAPQLRTAMGLAARRRAEQQMSVGAIMLALSVHLQKLVQS